VKCIEQFLYDVSVADFADTVNLASGFIEMKCFCL